ncbi:MAG: Ig-like domain-containing protein, partial [Gammaproteobacteria bacterium]|nr:Ig-like domain-containing protein [Gammaproteobacteria bacterium]
MRFIKLILSLTFIAALSACGGGQQGEGDEFKIISISPANKATNVDINTQIVVTFSQSIQTGSLSDTSFHLQDLDDLVVAGDIEIAGNVATFTPAKPLDYKTLYIAKISRSVASQANIALPSDYSYEFTTASDGSVDTKAPKVLKTLPADAATGIAPNVSVVINLDESVKVSSLAGISI